MANLIDKSALLAEIERRLNYRVKSLKAINDGTYQKEGQCEGELNESLARCAFNEAKNELFELKCFIDTLETKEVDLDKEIEEHVIGMPMSEFTHDSEVEGFWDWAREEFRHFFELGLKAAQKGE